MPTVSTVIPTRNRPALLRAALQSVALQDVPDMEVLVVDDASDDPQQTAAVVAEFAPRLHVRLIRLPQRRGTGHARNAGVLAAAGEYIAFLDDDDLWHPNKITRQLERFRTNPRRLPQLAVVYTWHQWVNAATQRVRVRRRPYLETLDDIFRWGYNTPQTMMIRRECFDRVGLFDEEMPTKQDWDLLARMIQHYQFDAVEEILVTCRDHHGPRRTDDYRARLRGAETLLDRYAHRVHDPRVLRDLRFSIGRLYLRARQYDRACAEMGEALRLAAGSQKLRYLPFWAWALGARFLHRIEHTRSLPA